MDKSKRNVYLSRIEADSLTVGVTLPDCMEVQNVDIPISKIVYDVCSQGTVNSEYNLDVSEVKIMLRRERKDLVSKIKDEEGLTESEAESYVEKIKYIDRARSAIQNPDSDIERESKVSEAKREKKWREFVRKVKYD